VPVDRLALTDFRSYASALIEPGSRFVLLYGENGAGKTNLLEAVSLLTPGRGLRGAALSEMARQGGSGGFAVVARVGETDIGTGTVANAPERRQVRINGAPASVNSLSEWLSVLWLTPAMDRLFTGSAGDRRRFLDRLVLALEPAHAHHSSRYEAAMRARNKLLAEQVWDEPWLSSLEAQMQEHGSEVTLARARTIEELSEAAAAARTDDFPSARLSLDKQAPTDLAARLSATRKIDAAARRATHGPNNEDLLVIYSAKDRPAAQCSTGEQKALLIQVLLSHAEVVADKRGEPPILLLDEVAAHLDPKRRAALFDRLEGRGQVWMTATEASLFDGIGDASRFHVEPGSIRPD
jgi:DNA replication and repair protein RecF